MHFAALKAVGESVERPLEYYINNVAGTLTLLQVLVYPTSSWCWALLFLFFYPFNPSHNSTPNSFSASSPFSYSSFSTSDVSFVSLSFFFFNLSALIPSILYHHHLFLCSLFILLVGFFFLLFFISCYSSSHTYSLIFLFFLFSRYSSYFCHSRFSFLPLSSLCAISILLKITKEKKKINENCTNDCPKSKMLQRVSGD